jgi:hypothetical protein
VIAADTILAWYSGKSLAGAKIALDLLAKSEAAGYWLPNASRIVKSRLNKQNIAAKCARALPGDVYEMKHGCFMSAPKLLDNRAAPELLRQWAADFAPVAELVAQLDARRPKPVIVCKTLSPSVVAHLARQLGLNLASVEIPPMKGEWVTVTRPIRGDRYGNTETVQVWSITILWPEGTRHCRSKFSYGSRAGNSQCEACGHAIQDFYNWVPLMAKETDGIASSLWVGRDCARKLLDCQVDNGEAIYHGRVAPEGTAL